MWLMNTDIIVMLSDFDKQDKKGVIAEISEFPFGTTSDPVS